MVVPDTQRLAAFNSTAHDTLVTWINDNISTYDVRMLLHVGDVVDDGTESAQWDVAEGLQDLRGNVPHIISMGNHDYDDDGFFHLYDRDTDPLRSTSFNDAFGFSHHGSSPHFASSYPTGQTDSLAYEMEIGLYKYLFIGLEFAPTPNMISWCNSVIAASDADRIVISTHYHLDRDGTQTEQVICSNCGTGVDMWDDIFSQDSRIFLVVSGHRIFNVATVVAPGTAGKNWWARRTDVQNGTTVHQHGLNFQNMDSGPTSYDDAAVVRMYEFDDATDIVSVTTYNPVTDHWWTDSGNQFTFNISIA